MSMRKPYLNNMCRHIVAISIYQSNSDIQRMEQYLPITF